MICKICGTEVPEGTAFCTNCGTAVAVDVDQTAVLYQTPVEETPAPEAAPEVTYEETPAAPAVDPGKTMGLISMIMGIVSIVGCALCTCLAGCLGGFVPMILGVVGLVLGIVGGNKSKAAGFQNKQAKIGLILSIVALVVFVIMLIVMAVAGGIIGATGALSY